MKSKLNIAHRAILANYQDRLTGARAQNTGLRREEPPFTAAERNRMIMEANAQRPVIKHTKD